MKMTAKVATNYTNDTSIPNPMDVMERDYDKLLNCASDYNMVSQNVKADLREKIKSIACLFLLLVIFAVSGTLEYEHIGNEGVNDPETLTFNSTIH